jgi:hypothetical protein
MVLSNKTGDAPFQAEIEVFKAKDCLDSLVVVDLGKKMS